MAMMIKIIFGLRSRFPVREDLGREVDPRSLDHVEELRPDAAGRTGR